MVTEAEPLDRQRPHAEVAARSEQFGATVDVHALALDEVELERVELPRAMDTGSEAPSVGSLSVKNTLAHARCRLSSVTSPSTQTVGSRESQSATPRLNAETL